MLPESSGSKIQGARVSAFTIPTDQPESDGTAEWDSTTVLIVELNAGEATGLGLSYTNTAAAYVAQELIQREVLGRDPCEISRIHSAMDRRVRNWGRPGLVSTAISAIDISLWDLKSRLLQCPLINLLGKIRDEIPAYGSGGFTSYTESQLVDQLTNWASRGLRFMKMKVGREPDKDIQRASLVQKALNGAAELYVDANGAYRRKQAMEKCRQFADLGVTWFEEPLTSDDRSGLQLMVQHAPPPIRIAAGEYCYVPDDARLLIEAQAVDVLQADVTRCGGITNFLKIADAAELWHLPLSAHTAPSIHTGLCCAVAPALNVEYFCDHSRIEEMIFDGAIHPVNGNLRPDLSRPGLGLELKRKEAHRFSAFSAQLG